MILQNLSGYQLEQLKKEMGARKTPIPDPLGNIEKVYEFGENYGITRDGHDIRFAYYFLYLTGQRVSEFLQTRIEDVKLKWINGEKSLVVDSVTLKNRNINRRAINIPLEKKYPEYDMAKYVFDYIRKRPNTDFVMADFVRVRKNKDGHYIPHTDSGRKRIHYYMSKKLPYKIRAVNPSSKARILINYKMHPHYLRHCRATHMVLYYNFDLYMLMQMFGWSDPKTASIYAVMNAIPIAEQMQKASKSRELAMLGGYED